MVDVALISQSAPLLAPSPVAIMTRLLPLFIFFASFWLRACLYSSTAVWPSIRLTVNKIKQSTNTLLPLPIESEASPSGLIAHRVIAQFLKWHMT
jgi:hypothetical protein